MMNKEQGDRHIPHDYKTWDGMVFPCGSMVKDLPPMQETQETWVQFLSQEDPLE